MAALLAAAVPAPAQFSRPADEKVRRLLLESGSAATERQCHLWRHFSPTAGGLHTGEDTLLVPFGDNRYGGYVFSRFGALLPVNYLARMGEAVPAVNLSSNDGSVTRTGTWVGPTADAQAWAGTYWRSSTAGDTITATRSGSTLGLRLVIVSNGGYATVSVDGDFTAANRLPAVTQALVDAGKFTQGQLGHRFIECYKATGDFDRDEAVCVADGLADAAHTVQVRVQGTKRDAASDVRVYVSAFCGGGLSTRFTDAGATPLFVRYALLGRDGFSSVVSTLEFSPTGFSNFVFMDEGHGNAAAGAEQYLVNGAPVSAPSAGAYLSGAEVAYDRTTTWNHPNAAACAARRVVHVGSAAAPVQLTNRVAVRWATAGTVRSAYAAMLPLYVQGYDMAATQAEFTHARHGEAFGAIPALNNNATYGKGRQDFVAAYSTAHDFVAVAFLPRVDLAVNGWARSGPDYTYLWDRSDSIDKWYFARSTAANPEAVAAGTTHAWENGYRMFRVPGAAARLAE